MTQPAATGSADAEVIPAGHVSAGRLERVLRAGEFVVTAEIAPPDSADPEEVSERARVFDAYVDAINATDGSGAHCHMSSVGVCALLSRLGYAMVMQMSCRDRNRIAQQGDVLGAAALGISNILCLTGDGVQVGDHPEAKPVFDMDSISLLQTVRGMREQQQFLSGRALSAAPRVFLGAAANPFVPPVKQRVDRVEKKIAAGAQFIQTQYCFDMPMLRDFMQQVRDRELQRRVFLLVGVGPLPSAKTAEWMRANVPGVHIPDALIKRLRTADKPRLEGRKICVELMQQLREIEGVAGVHLMAYRQEEACAEMIEASGILAGRVPWYPGCDQAAAGRHASS